MPTICHSFDRGLNTGGRIMRDNRWRRIQRSARGSRPLDILMIKALPTMIMVRLRVDGEGARDLRETERSTACPQNAQNDDTHD